MQRAPRHRPLLWVHADRRASGLELLRVVTGSRKLPIVDDAIPQFEVGKEDSGLTDFELNPNAMPQPAIAPRAQVGHSLMFTKPLKPGPNRNLVF